MLELESSISWNIRNFFQGGFFFGGGGLGLGNAGLHFRKYKKSFYLRVRKFYFRKYKKFFFWWIFFVFGDLSLESAPCGS